MKIYDISQEVFGCEVYPGDPMPKREKICSIDNGELYDLTAFSMCAHNGTHIDAPSHFIKGGRSVESIPLEKTVGLAYVVTHNGDVTERDAIDMLEGARRLDPMTAKRILIKGDATVTLEAAEVFAGAGIDLIGNESQTVGPKDSPMAVHKCLLSASVALLEGIRLGNVIDGVYFLSAAPINLGGSDGAPTRAFLIEF